MEKNDMIKIAEKVKFWEEQDRINKSIIPRILKNHDLISEVSDTISDYTNTTIRQEVKIKELQNRLDELVKNQNKFNDTISHYTNTTVAQEVKIKELQNKFDELVKNQNKFNINKFTYLISSIAVIISLLAIFL